MKCLSADWAGMSEIGPFAAASLVPRPVCPGAGVLVSEIFLWGRGDLKLRGLIEQAGSSSP